MDIETKYRLKAFLWDQFVRPFIVFFNLKQSQSILLALTFISIVVFKSTKLFLTFFIILLILYIYETILYYKSGEFMKNYRNYKYPEYRKAIKEIRKEKKLLTDDVKPEIKEQPKEEPQQPVEAYPGQTEN